MRSLLMLACAATASSLVIGSTAQAGFVVTLQQVGPNVVGTGSGAIDLTGLSFQRTADAVAVIVPGIGEITTGPLTVAGAAFWGGAFFGPSNFGSGGPTFVNDAGIGDFVGIAVIDNVIIVPGGYVSGNSLSDFSIYAHKTFASLGVTPGTYEWTWGTGANQNFTLKIGSATVPDSGSSFGLLFLSLAALFGAGHLRFRQPA